MLTPSTRAVVLAALLALLGIGTAIAEPVTKRVLVISAGDSTLPAGIALEAGLTKSLSTATDLNIELYVEYMDALRFSYAEAARRMGRTLQNKYTIRPADLVVAIGREALEFATSNRRLLGTDADIAFIRTGGEFQNLQAPPGTAGVVARNFFTRTLEMAERLQPRAKRLYMISGSSERDAALLDSARSELKKRPAKLPVTELVGLSFDALIDAVAKIPADSIVIYLSMLQDSTGRALTSPNIARRLALTSKAPLFGLQDTLIGSGIVGGYMDRYESVGAQAGLVGLRLLGGERADSIGAVESSTAGPIADWRAIEKFGIDESLLPTNTDIRFRVMSLWRRHLVLFSAIAVVVLGKTLLIIGLLFERRKRLASEQSLRELAGSVLSTRDDERRRLARELHDTTGQNIAVASLMLGAMKPKLDDDARIQAEEVEGMLKKSMQEIRTLTYVLHPPFLDEAGLPMAIPHFAKEVERRSNIEVDFSIDDNVGRLPPEIELTLFRVIQEALANIVLHSRSKSALIALATHRKEDGDFVKLRVEDYGVGFSPGGLAMRRPNEARRGAGLASMTERLRQVGGQLDIHSAVGRTVISVKIPLRGTEYPLAAGHSKPV